MGFGNHGRGQVQEPIPWEYQELAGCIWSDLQVKEVLADKIRGFQLSCNRVSFVKSRQLLNNSKVGASLVAQWLRICLPV